MNGYELSRQWFDWCFDNPEKICPNHTAMYFFIIEHCNRLGWKEKFGLPTTMVKDAIGIRNYRTYSKTLNDLVDWGFIKMIEKSKNQYSSNIIALAHYAKARAEAPTKALDKALQKHSQKHCKSIDSINKQLTTNNKTINSDFEKFWNLYDKKSDRKKCFEKWNRLNKYEKDKIFETLPNYIKSTPDKQYRKNPLTYLNGEVWNDEIIIKHNNKQYDEIVKEAFRSGKYKPV